MALRYLGFEQRQNARAYQFDQVEKGVPTKRLIVSVEMALFRAHNVAIQEGPTLSASKLTADLERSFDGEHELTGDDLRSHATARIQEAAHRAEMRKPHRKRPTPNAATQGRSPWGNFGL
jgi:hypothetical protein